MGFATDAIHIGQEPEPNTGAIVAPIYQTSTYVQEALGKNKGYDYARTAHPNRFWTMRMIITKYNANIKTTPTNPCSSANAEKMKSLCGTGKNRSCVWVPFVTPLPNMPPDPTAISDWIS